MALFHAVLTDRVSRSDHTFGFAFEFFFETALLGGDFGLRPEPMFYCFPFGPPSFLPDLVRPLLDPVFVPPTFHVLLHNWVRPEDRGPSLAPFRGSVRLFVAEISSRALQASAAVAIAAGLMASLAQRARRGCEILNVRHIMSLKLRLEPGESAALVT